MSWKKYSWNKDMKRGKLTYYYCNRNRSELPIRDVCNDHGANYKKEPHYEGDFTGFGTYNECASCNACSIDSMLKNKKANILFFVTWYTGNCSEYSSPPRRYYVTGYYTIDEIKRVGCPTRYAIKCYEPFFVKIEDAFEITEDVLREWRPDRKTSKIFGNQLKFYLDEKGQQTNQLMSHFKKAKNAVENYIEETRMLGRECPQSVSTRNARKCMRTRFRYEA